eukprot:3498623-Pleurochrysis_carterae.AAC.4
MAVPSMTVVAPSSTSAETSAIDVHSASRSSDEAWRLHAPRSACDAQLHQRTHARALFKEA